MKLKLTIVSIAGIMLASLAQAQPITIINPSFELNGTSKISGGWSTITGWSDISTATTGTSPLDSGIESDGSGFGTMNAYIKAFDSAQGIYPGQTTAYTIQAGDTFTLSFSIGSLFDQNGATVPASVEADLYYVSGGSKIVFASQTINFAADNLTGFSSVWTPDSFIGSGGVAGDLVGIDFKNVTADASGNDWLGVDNVSLNVTPVPEPTSLALFGMGAAGLLAITRRKA